MKKIASDIIILHVYQKTQSYEVQFLRYGVKQNLLSFWAIFCPMMYAYSDVECDRHDCHFKSFFAHLPHYWPPKLKFGKKCKKNPDIILLHMCNINPDHTMYASWDMKCNRQIFFVKLGHFLPFYPPNSPKNQNLKKRKKNMPRDIIILHNCTKNHDHMLYCSWDMARDGCNYFSFWAIFCLFTPLTA